MTIGSRVKLKRETPMTARTYRDFTVAVGTEGTIVEDTDTTNDKGFIVTLQEYRKEQYWKVQFEGGKYTYPVWMEEQFLIEIGLTKTQKILRQMGYET